jgi:3-oxoacyl-[acyl-carrier-protein] synthase II
MLPRIVVTGIGAVSPNGLTRESFWDACKQGHSGVSAISGFDASGLTVRIAGQVTGFDEHAWVTPKDRPHVSRTVPLALAAGAEALSDAKVDPASMSRDQLRRAGVVLGTGGAAQDFSEEQYRLYYAGLQKQCSVYVVPSSTPGTLSSELSMRFGFRGLSHVVTTGCASSTDAIGHALHSLRAGTLDFVLAGGADAPIAPLILRGFQLMRIMTTRWNADPTRASRPFSRDRDGFVIAEGAWMFVLESLDRALARGARVYGEIAGYGSTCEAFHRVRLEECGEEPARAMQLAMEEAGIRPEQVGYINYHGTSTELNDRIETRAVRLAFGSHADRLPGSALKSLIGHPQGACGAAGLAATLLAMRDGVAHPTLNLSDPDPVCDLDYIPNTARKLEFEHAVCNCIAFGSKNSALVVRRVE